MARGVHVESGPYASTACLSCPSPVGCTTDGWLHWHAVAALPDGCTARRTPEGFPPLVRIQLLWLAPVLQAMPS